MGICSILWSFEENTSPSQPSAPPAVAQVAAKPTVGVLDHLDVLRPIPTPAKLSAIYKVSGQVISTQEAYALLESKPGIKWEAIEAARQRLVGLSHPE